MSSWIATPPASAALLPPSTGTVPSRAVRHRRPTDAPSERPRRHSRFQFPHDILSTSASAPVTSAPCTIGPRRIHHVVCRHQRVDFACRGPAATRHTHMSLGSPCSVSRHRKLELGADNQIRASARRDVRQPVPRVARRHPPALPHTALTFRSPLFGKGEVKSHAVSSLASSATANRPAATGSYPRSKPAVRTKPAEIEGRGAIVVVELRWRPSPGGLLTSAADRGHQSTRPSTTV